MISAKNEEGSEKKYKRSEEVRKKIGDSNRGKKRSEAFKERMRNRIVSDSTREKMRAAKLGKKRPIRSKEWIDNFSKSITKFWNSSKGKQKRIECSERMKRERPHAKGKTWKWRSQEAKDRHSELKKQYYIDHPEERNKIAERIEEYYKSHPEIHRGAPFGEKNPNYRGGTSKYNFEWSTKTRYEILERDNYTCQNCYETEEEKKIIQQMDVHHLNGNTKDDRPENLITLHHRCHFILERHLMTEFFDTIRDMFEAKYKREMSKLEMKDIKQKQDKYYLKTK